MMSVAKLNAQNCSSPTRSNVLKRNEEGILSLSMSSAPTTRKPQIASSSLTRVPSLESISSKDVLSDQYKSTECMKSMQSKQKPQNNRILNTQAPQKNQSHQQSAQTSTVDKIQESLQREREGKCFSCGQRLYIVKAKPKKIAADIVTAFSSRSNDSVCRNNCGITELSNDEYLKNYKRIPISIPGKVERGQCLFCGTNTAACSDESSGESVDHSSAQVCSVVLVSGAESHNSSAFTNVANVKTNVTDYYGNHDSESPIRSSDSTPASRSVQANGTRNALYKGPYNAAGKRHGQGTMTWSNNGDVYVGDFVNGDRHGFGTLHFGGVNGGEYVGEWRHNQMSGLGTRRWPNGDCYSGDYLNGQRTGQGRFYFSNGDLYTGEFYADKIHGFGRYYYSNGQRFEGYFASGKRFGKGKLQRADGTLDVGVYRQDARVGTGVRWSPDRTETWRLENGIVKKKISVAEAVSLDYEMDAASALMATDGAELI